MEKINNPKTRIIGEETLKQRQTVLERLKEKPSMDVLWEAITLFAGECFWTYNGLQFEYTVKGGEIFVSRKEKSITGSSVKIAYEKTMELGAGTLPAVVTGPKKLGCFGASYLYPVFIRLGMIVPKPELKHTQESGTGEA